MRDSFPSTPRASRTVQVVALAVATAGGLLAAHGILVSRGWVGRVFPGFMLLDNRVIASVGLAHWSGTTVPQLYQSVVEAVDGRPVGSTAEIYAHVETLRPGTPVRYRIRRSGFAREVTIATQRFLARDWFLLFGVFLLNGSLILTAGLSVWLLRAGTPVARAMLVFGGAWALFLFTAMELYTPGNAFRLHVFAETMVPATGFHVAMLFPQAHRRAGLRLAGYAVSLALLVPYEMFLYDPAGYSTVLVTDMFYFGLVAVFFGWRLVSEYRRGTSQLARQRVRVITLGTLFGFTIPGLFVLASALFGGGLAMNAGALTPFLFALSLAYAIVKHDLFEIDAMVKRGAYYLFLTGAVGAAYVAAVALFNLVLKAGAVTDSAAFPILFTLAVLLLFNPLLRRLQAFVDRVFFRTRYDGAQVLAAVGGDLASAVHWPQIAGLVCDAVQGAIPNAATRLFKTAADGTLREATTEATLPAAVASALATGRVVTVVDPRELYPDAPTHDAVRAGLASADAEIAVPLQRGGELTGALTAGAKRSHLFYTAGDAEFLRALAHQAAIALENARNYEALVALNARLEERVRERTAQLESANRELADAYAELKSAEVQLVQSEKMASLGRLVAGVAHEINNPVSFIASNVAPLRRRLAQAALGATADVQVLLREAQEIADIMARGAERTAAIVKDLRTFSRLGEARRKQADLQEGVEVSLRLLETRWRDRITIHRDYGTIPPVEGDPGQLNQVFMNVLANACDAIAGRGNIWIGTRADAESVVITIRDDGAGMPPEVVGRIFEPFFTTKDVGGGTGLGLAISHSVIAAHGGRIDVESAPGRGSTFRIVLPIAVALDRAAGGGS
jgi:signal transduction histidine kinase